LNAPVSAQRKATIISTSVATLLVFVKLIIGILSGSVAVLASAIDSLLDMGVSMFNYFAIKKAEEEPDEEFHYGKGKIQAVAAVIEGTVITMSGLYIIYEAIQKLRLGKETTMLGPSIVAMLISIVATFFLVRYLLSVAEKTGNIVIKADALHYKTDLWSNAAVLLSLALVYMTGYDGIDALFGLGIGVYIIYSAYEIIVEGIGILLDKALPADIVEKIEAILRDHPQINGYHWLKTRTDGLVNFVEFHMVLRPDMLLIEAHDIADEVELAIIALDPDKRWAINPHFDPFDDSAQNEALLHGKIPENLKKRLDA
jgi:cation diffusion facilitator family transporter